MMHLEPVLQYLNIREMEVQNLVKFRRSDDKFLSLSSLFCLYFTFPLNATIKFLVFQLLSIKGLQSTPSYLYIILKLFVINIKNVRIYFVR